jgi:hypothetical protein
VAGCCVYGDEPSGSGATELVPKINVMCLSPRNKPRKIIGFVFTVSKIRHSGV